MKNTKGLIAISLFLFVAFATLITRNTAYAVADKVTICHATSSATMPYTQNVVSINAIGGHFENPGTPKAGHEADLFYYGEVPCPGGTTVTETPTPTPTDTVVDPTATPTVTATVTPTPTYGGDVIIGNIDPCFRQQACPTATPTVTPTETPGPTATPAPGTGGGSSDGGSSSSNNSSNGSVQGATTTLAATGVFTETLMNMVGLAGVMLTGLSAVRYGKKS